MSGYSMRSFVLEEAGVTLGAGETNTPVSKVRGITAGDSKFLNVVVTASGVSVTTGITAKLQHSYRKQGPFTDVSGATVAITGNGDFTIQFDATEAGDKALWPMIRVVVTTGADDAATVDGVLRSERR